MHLAVTEKHPEVFKLLLKNGADYKSKDNEGLTALHQAAFVGSTEIMKSLLANSDLGKIEQKIQLHFLIIFFKNQNLKMSMNMIVLEQLLFTRLVILDSLIA